MQYYKLILGAEERKHVMKKFSAYILGLLILVLVTFNVKSSLITTLSNIDPAPMYNSAYPYMYLYAKEKEFLKNKTECWSNEYISLSASPFWQRSTRGKNINRQLCENGDLTGHWNMIATLPYNQSPPPAFPNNNTNVGSDIPMGVTPSDQPLKTLMSVRQNLFDCISTISGHLPDQVKTVTGLISLQTPQQLFGFFSVPIKYNKRGVRFSSNIMLWGGFGIAMQTGVADISQVGRFIDLTTTPTQCLPKGCLGGTTNPCPTTTNPSVYCQNPFSDMNQLTDAAWQDVVHCTHLQLMNQLQAIADASHLDLCNFNKTSVEDFHIELFWRKALRVDDGDFCTSPFLFIPFFSIGGDIGIAAKKNQNLAFSVPFGNNGHNDVRFNAGFTFDFDETIEVGGHCGVTHFFDKRFKEYRMPVNEFQNGFYPYTTDVCVSPGNTWHIGILMNAYHFLGCLSFYCEYLYVSHSEDKFCIANSDPAFKPGNLECKSPWMVQLLNNGFYYDVSGNFSLGFSMQIPLDRRNAYKSTTYMLSMEMVY